MAPSGIRPCSHFLADFSDFVDEALPASRRAAIQAHLDCCEPCLRHLRAYRRGVGTYRRLEDETVPGLWAALEERIGRLEAADFAREILGPARESPLPAVGLAVATLLALVVVWASEPGQGVPSAQPALHPISMSSVLPVVADPAVTRARPEAGRAAIAGRSETAPPLLQVALASPAETDPWTEPIEIREVEMRVVHASVPLPWPVEAALSLP